MNRAKLIAIGAAAAVMVILAVFLVGAKKNAPGREGNAPGLLSGETNSASPLSQNAFVKENSGTLPSLANGYQPTASPSGSSTVSFETIKKIIAAAAPTSSPGVAPLPWPAVPDGDITIDAAGASTTVGYMGYFNQHSIKDIVFDNTRFAGVLKDSNGIIMLPPALIDRALGDGDFTKIHSSLLVYRDFIAAELSFLKAVKVSGGAVTLHKQVIGSEQLLGELIDKAFSLESGTISRSDFNLFYQGFLLTTGTGRARLSSDIKTSMLAPPENWFARILRFFGARAEAQTAGNIPFGGQIAPPVPCLCNLGFWVVVGPPRPASLFVPIPFMTTPLFYNYKSMRPGAWWLGLYDPLAQIPCLDLPFCQPIGTGGEIIMVGTSL